MGNQNKNILTHGGDKPIHMDFDSFGKRSIYKQLSQQGLEEALEKLKCQQQNLKKYKYHEDFDRLEFFQTGPNLPQNILDRSFLISIIFGFITAKGYCSFTYKSYASSFVFRRMWLIFTIWNFMMGRAVYFLSSHSHIINSSYYQQTVNEIRSYRGLDEKLNLYKYVNDIKYNFDYSNSNIFTLKEEFLKQHQQSIDERILKNIMKRKELNEKYL